MLKDEEIVIAEGPWSVMDHPNRQDPSIQHLLDPIHTIGNPMNEEQAEHWRQLGLLVDTAGRPLHPRAAQLLTTPNVGMFTGPGFHYTYGPQRMGNLGLRRVQNSMVEYAVTAVQRGNLTWGLPGGYAETGESVEEAAFREGNEEAGIAKEQLGEVVARTVISPPKGFKRDTLHAWGEEWFTFLSVADQQILGDMELNPIDTLEVVDAAWMSLDTIKTEPGFMSTHLKMILGHEAYLFSQR